MCTSPIKIYNRSRRFRPGIDKPVLVVPCGHCEQCEKKKQRDWFFRAAVEYKRCIDQGGFVWFPTLTFRDDVLPRWYDKEFDYYIPTFSQDYFTAFRNKLRIYLKRDGYDFKGEDTLRYFYACEYGGKYGRPHLHCLLFVPRKVPFYTFQKCVKKAWIYGFVMYSKAGRAIRSANGISYVMKYIHKDCLYYDKYKVDEYILKLKDAIKYDDDIIMKSIHENKLKVFKSRLPRHFQSMGFGSNFDITDEEFLDNMVNSKRLLLKKDEFSYTIPLYYKRKFLYDFDNVNKVYNINARGIHIKEISFNNLVNKLDMYYSHVIYPNNVEYLSRIKCPYLLDHPLYEVFNKLRNYDTKDIAIFSLVYDGIPLLENDYKSLKSMSKKSPVDFIKNMNYNAFKMWCNRIDNLSEPLIDDYKNNGAMNCVNKIGYSDLPVYHDFYLGLMFLSLFEHEIGKYENDASLRDYYNQSVQFGKLFSRV